MKGNLIFIPRGNNPDTGGRRFLIYGISQVSDGYIVGKLREMESTFANAESFELDRFVDVDDEVDDGEGMDNYEMLKLEAETRGLVWR